MAATAAALRAEAPYALDAKMTVLLRKGLYAAAVTRSYMRAEELQRSLLAAAEAAGWPSHSLALAHLKLDLHNTLCVVHQDRCRALAADSEERRLLDAASAIIFARLDAGTLLTCSPSENAFMAAAEAAKADAVRRHTPQLNVIGPPLHCIGYRTAMTLGLDLVYLVEAYNAAQTSNTAVPQSAVDDSRAVVRIIALMRSVRTAGPRADPTAELDLRRMLGHEAQFINRCHELSSGLQSHFALARLRPVQPPDADADDERDVRVPIVKSWLELVDTLGAAFINEAISRVTVGAGAQRAGQAAVRERWTPRTCAQCGTPEPEPRLYKRCSGCDAATCCCKEHQMAHWKAHKRVCVPKEGAGAA